MLETGIALEKTITGKATTMAELTVQVSALNRIRNTAEPTAEELAVCFAKVEKAAGMLAEQWHAERISELLALGRTEMWRELLANRTCKSVKVKLNKKTDRYEAETNNKGRVNYPDLNEAYVDMETARLEKEGAIFDPEDITIARDRKFNTYAPLFFNDCYKAFIDHNLNKAAAGSQAYEFRTRKNAEVKGAVPSVNQLVTDMNELVGYLLPENFTDNKDKPLHMLKKDVRTLGVALSNSTKTELKAKGNGHALNWLLNVIELRIEGANVTVTVEKAGMDSIRDKADKTDKEAK